MADETAPLGGSGRQVAAALARLEGQMAALRADNVRIKSDLESRGGRAGVAEQARAQAGTRARPEEETRALQDQTRLQRIKNSLKADEERLSQRAAQTTGLGASGRGGVLVGGQDAAKAAASQRELNALRQRNPDALVARNTGEFAAQTRALSIVQESASLRQSKLNALHTEFLDRLRTGGATLGEFRAQMGATIAKFAGWTAASAVVFGVLGAIRELGGGALDGLHAVNLLSRVMTRGFNADAAAAGLSKLSTDLNVPLKLAGDVTFRTAQTNKGLADALAVSRAALIAYKVDNVDATEAALKLTAIQQGLGISGRDVAGVFDQINAAQREFGVRVQYTLSGTAKASGAFRAAGGDFSHLLALLTTGVRVSGRTGDQLGTALQRSAGFISRPANQKLLRGFGIDPTQSINDIYEEAIQKAPSLAKRQQLQLARALSSPQLAPYIVGILQHGGLYKQILEGTSPQTARGSAQSELQKALKSPREELDKFTIGLQRLGFQLARLGAFQVFGVMLKAINGSITALNALLGLANTLPEPFRKAGVLLLEMIGLLKLARRFNVGASLPASVPGRGFLVNAAGTAKRQFVQGSRDELKTLEEERARTTGNLGALGYRSERQASLLEQDRAAGRRASVAGDVEGEKAALQSIEQREAVIKTYNTQILAALDEQAFQATRIAALKGDIAAAESTSARKLISQRGEEPVAPVGARPTTGGIQSLREAEAKALGEPAPTPIGGGSSAAAFEEEAKRQVVASNAVRANGSRLSAGLRSINESAPALGASIRGIPAAATSAGRGLAGAAGALRGAAGRILGLIGPFELFFIGLIAEQVVMDDFKSSVEKANADASRTATSVAGAERSVRDNSTKIKDQAKVGFFSGVYQGLRDQALGLKDAATQADEDNVALQEQLSLQSRNPILSGKANFGLFADTIHSQYVVARQKVQAGQITLSAYLQGITTAIKDAKHSAFITDKDKKALEQELADAKHVVVGQSRRQLASGTPDQNQTTADDLAAVAASATLSHRDRVERVKDTSYVEAAVIQALAGPGATSADLKTIFAAQDKIVSTAVDAAKAELDRALLYAHGQDQRNAAYDTFVKTAVQGATGGIDQRIAETRRRVIRDRKDLSLKRQLATAPELKDVGGPVARALDAQAAEAKVKFGEDSRQFKVLQKARKQIATAVRDAAKKEVAEAKFTENQELHDAIAAVQEARVASEPVEVGAIALKHAHDNYMADLAHYGAKDKRTLDALKTYIEAENTQAQNVADLIGEQFDIRIAQTRDPVSKAQLGVQKVQAELAHAKGSKRRQLLVEYYNALDALDQARLDIANSELDLAASRTDDPVQLAKIELRRAQVELKNAHGQAARNKALAAANTAKRGIANARVQATEEELDYEVQIGKITTQQEIDGLKSLLKIKNLGKQARLELLRKIGLLEHQGAQDLSSYELTVGNIKLPTVYEIRRAALQGLSSARSAAQFTNNVRATVSIYVNDKAQASTVGQQLEDVLGTGRSDLRSLGTGGL